MNLLGIATIVCIGLMIAGVAVVNAVSVEENQQTITKTCGATCGNSCTAQSNCGLSTCGATQGKSCNCGK